MMKKLRQPPVKIWGEPKREHDRILRLLSYNTWLFKDALNINDIHMIGMEVKYNSSVTDERCDMVFQDNYDVYGSNQSSTCYVLELKSDEADHEVLGQLKKAVHVYQKIGESYKCWKKVIGISVAKEFTASGMDLIQQEGYYACFFREQIEQNLARLELQEPIKKRNNVSNEDNVSNDNQNVLQIIKKIRSRK